MAQVCCGYSRPGSLPLLLESFDLTRNTRKGYRVCWLDHLNVAQASPGGRLRHASPGTARNSADRAVARKLLGLVIASLAGDEGDRLPSLLGDGGTLRRAAAFRPTHTPRGPAIVDPGRSYGP